MAEWDQSVDLAIIGSGGGGLVAALACRDLGLEPLVLEKQNLVGGSTAMSGGVVWLPNNPLERPAGIADSEVDGLAYFQAVVGDVGPASTLERRKAFLRQGSEMVTFLQDSGVKLVRCAGYSDYYSEHDGGKADGRSIEAEPFDARLLGSWHGKVQPGMAKSIGLAVKTNELRSLPYYNRSPKAFAVAARVWLRTKVGQLRRQDLTTNGAALVGRILQLMLAQKIRIWTEVTEPDLIVEGGRVVGVSVVRDGAPVRIQARRGVLLAAGGFAHNAEMREKYSGDQPNKAEWSIANPGDTGEVLDTAMRLGAKTDLLDEAWWLPSPSLEMAGSTLQLARQRPGAIFVNREGRRFCNESNSYVEVGKAMYANNGVPCWLIFDDGYRKRYAVSRSLPGRIPQEWLDKGLIKTAATIGQLAGLIGLDGAALEETVRRFNSSAAAGKDPDFGRGQSAYNICLGDPGYKPNAAVGPLETAPYYATAIYPSDVGTCGGLVTDEHSQVLNEAGEVIEGLYATGNITATVMGRTYPGAGASIGNSMVFGYIAAHHAAGRKD